MTSTTNTCCYCCSGQPNLHEKQRRIDSVAHYEKDAHTIRCTKLHELCTRGNGLHEIRSFIKTCPLSPRSMDRFGRSPLYWAIKLQRPDEIIRHIYHEAPSMLLSHDVYGKSCLDLLYAPATRNIRILRWLLEQDPSLAVSPSEITGFREPFAIPLLHRICIRWSLSSPRDAFDDFLEFITVTIDAAHRYRFCRCANNRSVTNHHRDHPEERSIPLLHMAMELGLPPMVLQRIATSHPDQVFPCSPSVSSMVPLQYYVSHYSPEADCYAVSFLIQLLNCYGSKNTHHQLSLSTTLLHVAIQNGFAWKSMDAIDRLVRMSPMSLHIPEQDTQLLPFQIAASTQCFEVYDTVQLDAVYGLLRAQPSVIQEITGPHTSL